MLQKYKNGMQIGALYLWGKTREEDRTNSASVTNRLSYTWLIYFVHLMLYVILTIETILKPLSLRTEHIDQIVGMDLPGADYCL